MKSAAPITHGLIDAVHRRIVVLRVLESIALGCAAAAVAGLLLLPIIWWRGRSPLGMAEMLLGLGAICGLIRGLAARPTPLDAAAEADRQLDLHDLLGTVLLLCRGGDDDLTTPQWCASLLAISETRCRDLRASTVIINRLGLRTWGGIGVLVGGLLTLSLLCAQPPDVAPPPDLTPRPRRCHPRRRKRKETSIDPQHPLSVRQAVAARIRISTATAASASPRSSPGIPLRATAQPSVPTAKVESAAGWRAPQQPRGRKWLAHTREIRRWARRVHSPLAPVEAIPPRKELVPQAIRKHSQMGQRRRELCRGRRRSG